MRAVPSICKHKDATFMKWLFVIRNNRTESRFFEPVYQISSYSQIHAFVSPAIPYFCPLLFYSCMQIIEHIYW